MAAFFDEATLDVRLAWLLDRPRFATDGHRAIKPGLERMEAMMHAWGQPQAQYPVVHIAGTNGKGSTASAVSAMLRAAGMRVGLNTSPHLISVGERIRVDGQAISLVDLAELLEPHRALFDRLEATFFEIITAASFLWFAQSGVEVAVIEVGLGGEWDATNVVTPTACGITRIDFDHTAILGDQLSVIAAAKAGIIKAGVPVFVGAQQDEAARVLRRRAHDVGAPLFEVFNDTEAVWVDPGEGAASRLAVRTPAHAYAPVALDLGGVHQAENMAVAVRIVEYMTQGKAAPVAALSSVGRLAGLRARQEWIVVDPTVGARSTHPPMLVDVAHNPNGMAALLQSVTGLTSGSVPWGDVSRGSNRDVRSSVGPAVVVFGCMADKAAATMLRMVAAAGLSAFMVDLPSSRAMPVADLVRLAQSEGVDVVGAGPAAEAYAWVRQTGENLSAVLVTGGHEVCARWIHIHESYKQGTRG